MTVECILKHVDAGVEIEIRKNNWIYTRVPAKEHLSNEWYLEFGSLPVYEVIFLKRCVTINLHVE